MDQGDCFLLGYITKSIGLKGELAVYLDVDNPQNYKKLESVFVEINKKLIPFFIERIKIHPAANTAAILFKDITIDETLKLVGKNLFLPLSFLTPLNGKKFYYHEIVGFEVVDKKLGNIGIVETVYDNANNPLLAVKNSNNQEILIPLIDQFIEKVDREKKAFYVKVPEGLIQLYISNESSEYQED